MPKLGLDRQQLAKFLPNAEAIRAFEQIFDSANATPTTIEEVATVAGTATALGNLALSLLASYANILEMVASAPPAQPVIPADDFTPAQYYGSMSTQNADGVDITGGTISGVTISGNITGNASTATALQTARTINGVSFDGTGNIVITDTTRALLAGSSGQAFSTAALSTAGVTSTTADLAITLSIRGASGRLNIYGYYDATNGVIMEARNAAMTTYVPLNIQGDKVSIYAPSGTFITNKLGYNGKSGEALQSAPAAAVDLPTSITAINNIIARLTALGTYT